MQIKMDVYAFEFFYIPTATFVRPGRSISVKLTTAIRKYRENNC
jgi:hypothetical protein